MLLLHLHFVLEEVDEDEEEETIGRPVVAGVRRQTRDKRFRLLRVLENQWHLNLKNAPEIWTCKLIFKKNLLNCLTYQVLLRAYDKQCSHLDPMLLNFFVRNLQIFVIS